jgi:hypothetical protein
MFIFGGRGTSENSQSAQILAVSSNGTVTSAGRLPEGLSDLAAVTLSSGQIVLAGGRDAQGHTHDEILTATTG